MDNLAVLAALLKHSKYVSMSGVRSHCSNDSVVVFALRPGDSDRSDFSICCTL